MIMPFDHFQRYKTISELVLNIKKEYCLSNLKILEIGANEQKNLEKFLPYDDIFYSDIKLPNYLLNDPHYFIADATNLIEIKDNSYDIVIASDVFEHIDVDKRRDFLSELYRVSKYNTIICFPFNSSNALSSEQRANKYYKSMYGEEYLWLEEHKNLGLPDINIVDYELNDLNINYISFQHGDIGIWEEMMKCHFFSCASNDLIQYREQIDEYYNTNIYPNDFSEENYRVFYVLYKDKGKNVFFNDIRGKVISEKQVQKHKVDELRRIILELKDINNIRTGLQINSFKRSESNYIEHKNLNELDFSFYFDMGNGFSENNKYTKDNTEDVEISNKDIKVIIPVGTRRLRFDPLESKLCTVYNMSILTDKGPINDYKFNGTKVGEYFIFDTTDPQIILDINDISIQWFRINANIIIYNDVNVEILLTNLLKVFNNYSIKEEENKYLIQDNNLLILNQGKLNNDYAVLVEGKNNLENEKQNFLLEIDKLKSQNSVLSDNTAKSKLDLDDVKKENIKLVEKINNLNNTKQDLENELNLTQTDSKNLSNEINNITYENERLIYMYNNITSSSCWKITKPIRTIMDLAKKVLKSNKYTYKFGRGVKCIKEHGFVYTVRLGLSKLNRRNSLFPSDSKQSNQVNDIDFLTIENNIKFSILVPLYNTKLRHLNELIESVINQNYSNWELCIADGSNDNNLGRDKFCNDLMSKDSRIKYKKIKNLGISENTNEASKMATGEYIVLCDHDDILDLAALYENAVAIQKTEADILYSDEDHITETGRHVNPLYKPDWSRDLLYSQMYVCHLFVIKLELFKLIGGFNRDYDGSQDYDLMLRLSELTENICHIPRILYSWRETETSTAINADSKPYANGAGLKALNSHLKRMYGEFAYANNSEHTFVYDTRFNILDDKKVSIIIPMKDKHELTNACIDSILTKSTYKNYEILILDNRSSEAKTIAWLTNINGYKNKIRVIKADFEFNWSKLNNFGIDNSDADVFIFLNNDTIVISEDWIERLCENALRNDVGVVGPLLLYEDNTIQHAGVVVGIGGWADHIFKGMKPIHQGTPYVSPMVNRNVLGVTGACMAVSRDTLYDIGNFDESFIICGSDVELGIRAHKHGLNNLYNPHIKLYHLESKSRDSFIPEVDFQKSYTCYTPYRENGDPFFNINLDINSVHPKERVDNVNLANFRQYIKNNKITAPIYEKAKNVIKRSLVSNEIPEIQPLLPRPFDQFGKKLRLNLLVPSIDKQHVFGGIATALKFYQSLGKVMDIDMRIIVTDSIVNIETSVNLSEFKLVNAAEDSFESKQIISFADRYNKTFAVAKNDIFISTGWWTAYTIADVIKWQSYYYNLELNKLIYLIQDYEPGFYPWSSRYLMADSTYKLDVPTIAVFNSKLLMDYFKNNGYLFIKEYYFDPTLNYELKNFLLDNKDKFTRKKQILIYGRPSVQRNAFELIVYSLKEWCQKQQDIEEWNIISAGELFDDIDIGRGRVIKSLGKLSLKEYGKTMLETSIGISLMVSPHPSYPPLEMATFGIRTITNCYANKDLDDFNNNIISLKNCSATTIASELLKLCNNFIEKTNIILNESYVNNNDNFKEIIEDINNSYKKFYVE